MATNPPPTTQVEPSESSQHKSTNAGIVRSAGIVSVAVLLSRITGLVREVVLAHFFGASMVFDAYLAAFRIPNLMRDLLAEGALSAAFVTTFSQELSSKGDEAAFRLSNLLASVLAPMLRGNLSGTRFDRRDLNKSRPCKPNAGEGVNTRAGLNSLKEIPR
jgi:hypothetical protein